MQLLEARRGFGLDQRILVVLHHGACAEERRTGHADRRRVAFKKQTLVKKSAF